MDCTGGLETLYSWKCTPGDGRGDLAGQLLSLVVMMGLGGGRELSWAGLRVTMTLGEEVMVRTWPTGNAGAGAACGPWAQASWGPNCPALRATMGMDGTSWRCLEAASLSWTSF
jgi:hypothetical protein